MNGKLEPGPEGAVHVSRSEADASWAGPPLSQTSRASSGTGRLRAAEPVARLVRRAVAVSDAELQQLEAWEAESWRGGQGCCSGVSCCLPVLHPTSRAYAWWALLMLLLDLTYTAVLCPVSVAFSPRASLVSWTFIVDFLAGLLFSGDVLLNFNVGYAVTARHGMQQRVVMSRRGIARLYCLHGTFLVDTLSTVAWFAQCAVLVMAWAGSDPTSNVDLAHVLRIARILRILRVLRLLKHLYLSHMSGAKRMFGLRPHTMHVLQLFYVAAIIVNFCGCLWFFIAREAGFQGSWVAHWGQFVSRYSADGGSPLTVAEAESIPISEAYLASIYWASTTILTVGYGDILPWSPLETGVCMIVQLLGICFFGALLSSIGAIIQRASKAARRGAVLEEKLASVERYMAAERVPRDVRRRVKRFYADIWVRQQDGMDVGAFYGELPHTLRTDLASSIACRTLSHLRCFRAIQGNAAAMRALASRLEPLELPPGFTLCEEGEEATACWVLQQGQVCLSSVRDLDGQEEEEVVEGPALVGEEALLGASLGHPCHLSTVSSCKMWRLDSSAFLAALRVQPQAVEAVRAVLLHGCPRTDGFPPMPSGRSTLKTHTSGSCDVPLRIYVDARSRSCSQTAESGAPSVATQGEAAGAAAAAAAAAATVTAALAGGGPGLLSGGALAGPAVSSRSSVQGGTASSITL